MQLLTQAGDLGPKWFHVALRAMVLMADSKDRLKSGQIAEAIGEDPTFIRKILAELANAGLVETYGGRYGGYGLAKEPDAITVKDVYKAFETAAPAPHWYVKSTGSELFISLIISKAEENFQAVLGNFTIADILREKSGS